MKVGLYSIRDHLVGVSFPPLNFPSDAAAERAFRSMAENPSSTVYQNPSDFSVQKIGEFDLDTGNLHPAEQVEIICSGQAHKE